MNYIKDIYATAKRLNIEIGSHCSDLYLPVNDTTRKMIAKLEYRCNVELFRSAIDGTPWYDIPFHYTPFFNKKDWVIALLRNCQGSTKTEGGENDT